MDFPLLVDLLCLTSANVLLLSASTFLLLYLHFLAWSRFLHPFLRLLLGALLGIACSYCWSFLQQRRGRRRQQHTAYTHQMSSVNVKDLFRLLPREVVESAKSKKVDELNWFNLEIAKAWPYLDKAISDIVKQNLQPVLDGYKMGLLESVEILSLSFGVDSPRFCGVKVEAGSVNEAMMETEVQWKPKKEKITFAIKTIGPDFTVKVHNVQFSGTMRFVFKPLTAKLPGFGAILISMADVPKTNFDLKITDGDISALPGVDKMIDNSLRTAIEDALVWPNRIVYPILPGDYGFLELRPVGILDVSVLEATDVMNTDILGKSDCFNILYVRKKPDRIKRSSTKKNTLHPVWNEGFKIEVDDPQCQVLTIQLMDEESLSKSDYIGKAVVPLKDLRAHEAKELWLDMTENPGIQVKFSKPRARMHVMLVYQPFEDSKTSQRRSEHDTCIGNGGESKLSGKE